MIIAVLRDGIRDVGVTMALDEQSSLSTGVTDTISGRVECLLAQNDDINSRGSTVLAIIHHIQTFT